jgi:isopenicillin-N N-acyltransferase-like protein
MRMASDPMPVIHIKGSHREVGRQIGEALKPTLQRYREMAMEMREHLPPGVTWPQMVEMGQVYLAYSRAAYPQYVDELEGIAEAAGLPFEETFVELCEELWESPAWRAHGGGLLGPARGCTDLVARGRATVGGATLVAHTNDLQPQIEKDLVILRIQAGDEPEFLGVTVGGLGYSAGFNAAGICMSGNELACNDIRPGVPRLLVVRAILAARRLGDAVSACLLPQRASSYNNIVGDPNGEVYSMEGSATDCEPVYIDGDILAHANHYASAPMRRFEADRNDIGGSVIRHNRGLRLLHEHYGQHSPERFKTLLADHANYPASICKHGPDSVTVFSMILDLGARRGWIGRGRPCETQWVEHCLEPWAGDLPGVRV